MRCLKYRLNGQSYLIIGALCLYALIMLVVSYALVNLLDKINEGSLVYRFWGQVWLVLAVGMRFKEDFNLLLPLGNTRKDIFLAHLLFNIGLSMVLGILIIFEKVLIDYLNGVRGYVHIVDPFHFVSPYRSDDIFLIFLYFFTLGLAISMFGQLMGTIFYRYGKKFIVTFWLVLSAFPLIILPSLLWAVYSQGYLRDFIQVIVHFFEYYDLQAASINQLILAMAFSVAAYFSIRRLPQK
jgi:hypothetical protein